ncbi:MAG: aldehyde dehydrogenase family protein [Deltaproteobacteria bacterium]|nr:MAG: aldehyde dehydrogenase family protein [Deltaproteobacteria bacterium]TMQ25072.1 MAG: aldehyde dehydrogenase family protein [Deltaproteobacteria bacterium]
MATAATPSERLSSYNPATHDLIGTVPIHGPAEVDAAVARARVAAERWGALSFQARSEELTAFRKALAARADEIAELLHRENGKPEIEALTEVMMALSHVQHATACAESAMAPRRVSAGILANFRATISYHPLGVVGVIGPWNYPLFTPMGSIAYALAAGNAVVWKPSELTPLIAVKIAEIAQQTFALPDLLQVVTGAGPTGAALARAAVDKIAFTGSPGTGRRVMMAAAERLTPVLLELGGKDPMIVAEDADLAKAAEACVFGALTNAGQACISVERVYVADAVHDRFVDEVVKQVRTLKVGGDDGQLGAMTSTAQVAIVKDHLEDAVAKGAKVLTGGPDAISGSYIQPTVLTNVDHRMKVMTDETFGPVIPIKRVGSLDEAVKLANDSRYGLGSSIFAGKGARAVAARLRAGMTSINAVMSFAGIPSLPFGGVGDSGFGRIHGDEGIREFTRVKSTAEQVMSLPINMMSFRQPKDAPSRLRQMIKQLYGSGVVAKASDWFRKLRS